MITLPGKLTWNLKKALNRLLSSSKSPFSGSMFVFRRVGGLLDKMSLNYKTQPSLDLCMEEVRPYSSDQCCVLKGGNLDPVEHEFRLRR